MNEILKEQGFQMTGCTSSECAVEAGKILNVAKMVGGSIGKIGTTYTLDLRIIDVATGKIESISTVDTPEPIDNVLQTGIPSAIVQLLKSK
jgi:hypothetical protein